MTFGSIALIVVVCIIIFVLANTFLNPKKENDIDP